MVRYPHLKRPNHQTAGKHHRPSMVKHGAPMTNPSGMVANVENYDKAMKALKYAMKTTLPK